MSKTTFCLLALSFLFAAGCDNNDQTQNEANLESAIKGKLSGVEGEVVFTKAPDGKGVQIMINAKGLERPGLHAVHIHEKPVCEGDFASAGGHYNPTNKPHGSPEEKKHHVGDLGNFKASAEGVIVEKKVFEHLSLDPSSPNYVGDRALVIHEKVDDYASQPSGAAGARIGCAVLQNAGE